MGKRRIAQSRDAGDRLVPLFAVPLKQGDFRLSNRVAQVVAHHHKLAEFADAGNRLPVAVQVQGMDFSPVSDEQMGPRRGKIPRAVGWLHFQRLESGLRTRRRGNCLVEDPARDDKQSIVPRRDRRPGQGQAKVLPERGEPPLVEHLLDRVLGEQPQDSAFPARDARNAMIFRDGQRQHQAAPGRKNKDAFAGDGERDVAIGEPGERRDPSRQVNCALREPRRDAHPVENQRRPLHERHQRVRLVQLHREGDHVLIQCGARHRTDAAPLYIDIAQRLIERRDIHLVPDGNGRRHLRQLEKLALFGRNIPVGHAARARKVNAFRCDDDFVERRGLSPSRRIGRHERFRMQFSVRPKFCPAPRGAPSIEATAIPRVDDFGNGIVGGVAQVGEVRPRRVVEHRINSFMNHGHAAERIKIQPRIPWHIADIFQ